MKTPLAALPAKLPLAMTLVVVCPWLWLCSVYATWLVARISLGRSPRPLLDDPKHLSDAVGAIYDVSVVLFLLLLPLGFAGVAAALWLGASGRARWKAAIAWLGALLLSWLFAVLYARTDPGRVVAWFGD